MHMRGRYRRMVKQRLVLSWYTPQAQSTEEVAIRLIAGVVRRTCICSTLAAKRASLPVTLASLQKHTAW
jgi:hypothetical protein